MSGNKPAAKPTITLPPRTSSFDNNIFSGGGGQSPGPLSLVSSFFQQPEEEEANDYRSFSQLLAGAISPVPPPQGLMFTLPLEYSPNLFSSSQSQAGPYGISQQQFFAHVTAQAQLQSTHIQQQPPLYPSLSSSLPQNTSLQLQQKMTILHPLSDPNFVSSHYDQKPHQPPVDKPTDDGYNWRKYGQKQVKGSDYPRSYYKCTHPNCPVKKKVERSLDGQITEIIYKGQHNHSPPTKRTRDNGNVNGTINPLFLSSSTKDQESSQVTPDEHISGSSDSEEAGNTENNGVNGRDEDDEPESKRRNIGVHTSEQPSSHRTVTEPRIIVQATSEVDLLDDGYRWRKYGQKVVKGNPHPRSYYKCTNPGCNVRKHVERAASDRRAVVTTYEGKHNHDVPAAKNSSHNTANSGSQLRPLNTIIDRQLTNRRTEFGDNDQQSVALLQFKEEQITLR